MKKDVNSVEKELLSRICEIEKQLIRIEAEAGGIKLTILAASSITAISVVLSNLL